MLMGVVMKTAPYIDAVAFQVIYVSSATGQFHNVGQEFANLTVLT